MPISVPILATKLYTPVSRVDLVSRPRLIERLNSGLSGKLTLLSAPAGFGKTTLLATWLAQVDVSVAWLSLDEADSDPICFLNYFIAALQTVKADLGDVVLDALHAGQSPPLSALLTPLINDLVSLSTSLLLLLDDYHLIDAPPIDEALGFVLEHLPPHVHIVIATREDPQLPLARLRARRDLNELRAADLRFTADEAATFLTQTMTLALSSRDIAALETRTEGWITGLQLAALSLQRHDDATAFIATFAGSHRFVLDYLVEEVLRRQTDEVRRFLLYTSILERLNGALCDAVTGRSDGEQLLATLERSNLFVVPLDENRQWYRYHHLFADVLRNQPLDLTATLHRRACDWYARHGFVREAIRHALAAPDDERAADLIEQMWPTMEERYQSAAWLRWARALPVEVVRERPALCLGYGRSLAYAGDLDGSEAWLQAAEHGLANAQGASETQSAPLHCARAYLALAKGDVAATLHHAQQAHEQRRADDDLSAIQATALSGVAYWAVGELATADRIFSDFVVQMERAGRVVDAIEVVFAIVDIRTTRGQLRRAQQACEHAFGLLHKTDTPLMMGAEDLHRSVSELHRERGALERADDHLTAARELSEQLVIRPDWEHRLNITAARLELSRGNLDAALAFADLAAKHYTPSPLPLVRPATALKARVWICRGDLDAADDWARDLPLDGEITYLNEFAYLTFARLQLARYDLPAAHALLARLLSAARNGGRTGSVTEVLAMQALAYDAGGDTSAALTSLARALTLAEPEGYVRLFADEGAPMAALLRAAVRAKIAPDYVRRLLASLEGAATQLSATQPSATQGVLEPLSERERDVLRLLGTDLSGPDIARELTVSLNTLRTHTKNIYSKLGVHSRRAALRRAADLGLR